MTEYPFDSRQIFENHALDYYLKTFMRLTTGFDFSEDTFPFLAENVFFDGPDPELQEKYEELFDIAKLLFFDNDAETRLNFDRLTGELKRSILLSPRKYRNRIIFPKLFERTYCVFIDPLDFDIFASKELKVELEGSDGITYIFEEDEELLTTFEDPEDKYTQYYVTLKLHPHYDSIEYQYEDVDTGVGGLLELGPFSVFPGGTLPSEMVFTGPIDTSKF